MSSYWLKAALVGIAGDSKVYRRSSRRGRWLDLNFCPNCGNTVFWYAEFAPNEIGVSVGSFADPASEPPSRAVWCETKHPWVSFPASCKERQEQLR
jgi:hypothetical protein